ncbi:ribonuclease HI/DNA polymerase-3 subunit epsilon [Acinetobacter calcoaceticus]|uniref:Ribonuclease H n=1 Tax=Acinetobacter calcoaceticus TaxID=471 RepID=A0A4V2R1T8_ACICA|nr:ribonuclease HI/DNA polymerase-3 subunit epsilon [Acinetobacter calcoaceticus]
MSQTITLYVDGACRGNPGLGGWGAYVIDEKQKHELCGGEANTTNNRMELRAAIEGIRFCAPTDQLIIWTDSTYVKRGITEWITGWKKKNWKDVKNPDLWKELDQICENRQIEWNWVKGHAGHPGNEKADQLANRGADHTQALILQGKPTTATTVIHLNEKSVASNPKTVENIEADTMPKKKAEADWLLDDPFGFDLMDAETEQCDENAVDLDVEVSATDPSSEDQNRHPIAAIVDTVQQAPAETAAMTTQADITTESTATTQAEVVTEATSATLPEATEASSSLQITSNHPHIVITPATVALQGPRQLILDTETTGFYFQDTDRIVEVGAIEMINRKLTGSSIHIYINPEKPVGDSADIHGITDEFLVDKPKYAEIAAVLFEYLKGAEIIAHNAAFDMNFLNMEFKRSGYQALSEVCSVTDTLALAKSKHPGQKNSLDALVRRYDIQQRDRTFHGALLDAEILSDVYLAMTGGQVSFDMDALSTQSDAQNSLNTTTHLNIELAVILPSDEERAAHEQWMQQYQEKNGEPCLFAK